MNVLFKHWNCQLRFGRYKNNRIAIELIQVLTGEPIAVATVNLPDVPLEYDEVIIKDYSENQGMYKCLLDAGVISEVIRFEKTGMVTCPVCKLIEPEEKEPELEYPQ